MYHRMRRKMLLRILCAIYLVHLLTTSINCKTIDTTTINSRLQPKDDFYENNIVDFDDEYDIKFNKKFGFNPEWNSENQLNKESHRYTIIKSNIDSKIVKDVKTSNNDLSEKGTHKVKDATTSEEIFTIENTEETTTEVDYSVLPLELVSTTENVLLSIVDSTTEPDLTVIPLSTTMKTFDNIKFNETITLPTSTEYIDLLSTTSEEIPDDTTDIVTTLRNNVTSNDAQTAITDNASTTEQYNNKGLYNNTYVNATQTINNKTLAINKVATLLNDKNITDTNLDITKTTTKEHHVTKKTLDKEEEKRTNSSKQMINSTERIDMDLPTGEDETQVPIFTELDLTDSIEVSEDYYDSKDVVPTKPPNTDAFSVIFGLAGSVVESVVGNVAERLVPKGISDLFRRMQRQSEALEAERLRSREENGGLGQFGRGILKSISSGLSRPLTQLMAGARDNGSLDSDRSFVSSLASGVTNVANSLSDTFKDRVQAIYPGTVWCGDGHMAQARSSDLGLFFFTDTCCRQHDACKIYIRAGSTKYGLTNTGLFTRSHCSCDAQFRECLRKTNSLVSAQIGLTYFNVLGPQCFRKAHPIVRCVKKTRITGQKCEEYELDYTKPKMWQWFDNETF